MSSFPGPCLRGMLAWKLLAQKGLNKWVLFFLPVELIGPQDTVGSYILLLTISGNFKCPEPGGRGKMKRLERYHLPWEGEIK